MLKKRIDKEGRESILARILAYEGIIKNDKFKECGKEDLVGKYVGWTAAKIKEMFTEIVGNNGEGGGVLFIDEAYSLTDDQTTFDKEALTTIVQCSENYRDKVMVIFGGYKDKMIDFLNKNAGLKSRIAFTINFRDYTNRELYKIFEYHVNRNAYKLEANCEGEISNYFAQLKSLTGENFGNGREARNLYELASIEISSRVGENKKVKKSDVIVMLRDDVSNAIRKSIEREVNLTRSEKKLIGF